MTQFIKKCTIVDTTQSKRCKLYPLELTNITLKDGFWRERYDLSYRKSLDHLYQRMMNPELSHAFANLEIAAGEREGEFAGEHWADAWVYKWIESASVFVALENDEKLNVKIDALINTIVKAQEADGYLASQVTTRQEKRFVDNEIHELYTMGHLLTAAVIHYRFTGKTSLLDVALNVADFTYNHFLKCDSEITDMAHNPSIIMGLVELYRITRNQKHLDIAKEFIDMRGRKETGGDMTQVTNLFREEKDVVGHAVFFTYLYASAADVYSEIDDPTILATLENYFTILTQKKSYITGGVASIHIGLTERHHEVWEAAGPDYYLPSGTAYNETCSQVGSFMWNWRMLLISADAKHADVMENTLYNGILPGISLAGTSWMYPNVLRAYQGYRPHVTSLDKELTTRVQPGLVSICCPTNVLRTFTQISNYLYTTSDEGVWFHQYSAAEFEAEVGDVKVTLSVETDIPWGESFSIEVKHTTGGKLPLYIRVPSWQSNMVVSINGKAIKVDAQIGEYLNLNQAWKIGDTITCVMTKEVTLYESHPFVENLRNQVAVKYGPIMYCLESFDLPEGVKISEVYLPQNAKFELRVEKDLLGGITVLETDAVRIKSQNWDGALYQKLNGNKPESLRIRLIPYYTWANRGESEMAIWLPLYRT